LVIGSVAELQVLRLLIISEIVRAKELLFLLERQDAWLEPVSSWLSDPLFASLFMSTDSVRIVAQIRQFQQWRDALTPADASATPMETSTVVSVDATGHSAT
jgi:hypothetical protein